MLKSSLRQMLTAALAAGAVLGATTGPNLHAQSVGPSSPPATLDSIHPTVTGILAARPGGKNISLPAPCRGQGSSTAAAAAVRNQGLIVCTGSGHLVLLELSPATGIYARFWGRYALNDLRDGDRINAWGVLQDGGLLLNPTFAVQDTDMQEANVDSQDFVMQAGRRIALGVLRSEAGSPVHGIVHAVSGGGAHITLCGGQAGRWGDLRVGNVVGITRSLFNRRLSVYVNTNNVTVLNCR